ncbi:conjugative transfer ATPase [Carnimonas bestiolae]|uniref:conjugative transfer ATPase n=1 Tax=Carnimonas bestiolae TaxID=3402172 RepID=UPI003EDC2CA0
MGSAFNDFMNKHFGKAGAGHKADVGHEGASSANDEEVSSSASVNEAALVVDAEGRPLSLPRGKPMTQSALRSAYKRKPSFASRLPWVEYLPEEQVFLLEDGVSVGAVAEITPAPTEGRSTAALATIRDMVESSLQDSLPLYDENPWVVQFYCQDETDTRAEMEMLRDYIARKKDGLNSPDRLEDPYTKAWLESMERHFEAIGKPGGLFTDDVITQAPWRGQVRRTRLVVYRWNGSGKNKLGERRKKQTPTQALNHVMNKLESAFRNGGLSLKRCDGRDFHRWMMPRFNPAPKFSPEHPQRFYDLFDYPGDGEDRLWNYDLSEGMLASSPYGDAENGLWYFDGQPSCCVPVEEMRGVPAIGHLTGEIARGESGVRNATFDILPQGVEMCLTLVAIPQEPLEDHINFLASKSVGDSVLATNVREDCLEARRYLGQNHSIFQSSLAFFVSGTDDADLQKNLLDLTTVLSTVKLKPVDPEDEVAALNTYLRWLPMNFDPQLDRKNRWYTQLNFVQHLANLAPVYGRNRGTGHPGFSFFNRGGEPFTFDPLSRLDRAQNAHMFIFGPTGSGKSATLNALLAQVTAMRRPRLFIIEKGNSFGLLADYFERMGLSVNKVKLSPNSDTRLPPFAEANRLLDDDYQELIKRRQRRDKDDGEEGFTADNIVDEMGADDGDDDELERDILQEMEIMARLMITGGDPKEEAEYRRADNRLVRDAILKAAKRAVGEGRQTKTEDVRWALHEISKDTSLPAARAERAYNMGESLGMFTDGFDGQVFNTEGEAWPECDVTLVDLAYYSNAGYGAQLALSVMSITNMITSIAERDQYSGRPIIQVIDECHLLTVNPLLSPLLVSVAKMGRKLNFWLWLATQNVKDFPDVAAKMLDMLEWWLLLNMPPNEIKSVSQFKTLSEDEKLLIESATKATHKYTEGVVLSERMKSLFRVVPPSLYLSLAGTEPDEKRERREIMDEEGCDELEAAIRVAERLDKARGLGR